jgi:Flp pilus assembly protein TadD
MKLRRNLLVAALLVAGLAVVPAAAAAASAQGKAQGKSVQRIRVPDPLSELLARGYAALQKKDYEAAAQLFRQYLAAKPDDATAHFELGYACTALERWPEARAEYEKAVALDPKMVEAQLNLGLVLLPRDPAAAVAPLQKAVALAPDKARPHLLLGKALEASGKLAQAGEQYQAAAKLDADNPEVHQALAQSLLALHQPAQAEAEFRRALAHAPNSLPAHLGLVDSLVAQDKSGEAIQVLQTYLQLQPQDRQARLRLASLLLAGERYEEAARALAPLGPGLEADRLRGEIYIAQKQYAAAAGVLEKAVALAPQDARLRARLGHVYLEERDIPKALDQLSRALRLDAGQNDALRDLVAARYLSGDYAGALTRLDQLARREPLAPVSWFVRATCYDKLSRKAEALDAYQKFLALDHGQQDRDEFWARQRIRILTFELQGKK